MTFGLSLVASNRDHDLEVTMKRKSTSKTWVADQPISAWVKNDRRSVAAMLRRRGDGREKLFLEFAEKMQREHPTMPMENIMDEYAERCRRGRPTCGPTTEFGMGFMAGLEDKDMYPSNPMVARAVEIAVDRLPAFIFLLLTMKWLASVL